ncbi:hypothetical protein TNCV_2350211 [Trichonephila clavipes]|uniref:Uncharacterized protein n=1 Tax=Trichonephila clavipes TaxID=2585209 RepID=A0A8X6SVZ0_TRICX|nr:hypothetical protein TNCV_2350211 [Trichonephila clavipes]
MFKIIIFLCLAIVVTEAIVCPPHECENVSCKSVSCGPHQKLKKNGGFCGCCDSCVTQLEKGDNCGQTFLRGSPPTVECKKDLKCNPKTRKCE